MESWWLVCVVEVVVCSFSCRYEEHGIWLGDERDMENGIYVILA